MTLSLQPHRSDDIAAPNISFFVAFFLLCDLCHTCRLQDVDGQMAHPLAAAVQAPSPSSAASFNSPRHFCLVLA
jgi:hypothetical protein